MRVARFAVMSAVVGCASPALAAPPAEASPSQPASASGTPTESAPALAPAAGAAPSAEAPSSPSAPPTEPSAPAPSASSDDARLESARRLGAQGLAAFDERAYVTAIERLTGALEFHDAPTLRLYRARAFGKLGRWVAACEDYDAILRSRAARDESTVVAQARDAATQEGTDACGRIAKLRLVDVAGAAREVRLDGTPWPARQLDRVRYLDPGPHGLERVDARARTSRRVLSLAAGETLTVSLRSLEPVSQARVDGELLRFLAERPRTSPSDSERSQGVRDTPPPARPPAGVAAPLDAFRPETFRLEASPLGSMYHDVDVSERGLQPYADDSTSLVARLALAWFPLPEGARDYLGIGATWVQDFGTGRFAYSKQLARLMSRYSLGRWRFGAGVGTGYQHTGVDLLDQRFSLVEPSLEAGARFGDFSLDAAGNVVIPVGYSATSLYAELSGYGVEGRVALDYHLWRWLGVQLSLSLSRFDFDLDAPDDIVLDGAPAPSRANVVDRYASGYLGVSVSL